MALAEPAEATVIDAPPRPATRGGEESLRERLVNFLPRGNLLSDEVWRKRHNILQWLLLLHLPALVLFGFYMKHPPLTVLYTVAPIAVFRILGGLPTGHLVDAGHHRRADSGTRRRRRTDRAEHHHHRSRLRCPVRRDSDRH
jgi:hypothetical protein